jgi:hypothetical protein
MKQSAWILAISTCLFAACSTSRTNTTTVRTTESANAAMAPDQIEYYETEFEGRQKDYLDQLAGSWKITTMQRQQRQNSIAVM